MKKNTHIGLLCGCDNRTPDNYTQKIRLRETKNFWVTEHGTKYRKGSGCGLGKFPMYFLDLKSIQPITEEK